MCKSRCIANYKIKFHWSKMKYIHFYPMTSLATSLAKINCACTAFITTISFLPLTFLGQIQSMKYCQRSKYFLFWNHIMKKKGGKKLIFSFSLFLILFGCEIFNNWKSNILWQQKKFPLWSYKLCLYITRIQ